MDAKLKTLLRDFGFKIDGDTIIDMGVKGFIATRIWGRCRSVFDAVEQLLPIIKDDEFYRRYREICPY